MEEISQFPHTINVAGETIKMEKNRIYKTWADGSTGSMSISSDIIGVAVSEPCDEYVIVMTSVDGFHVMSRIQGWFGPFEKVDDISFDTAAKTSAVLGKKDGAGGTFPLVRD
jgi:hypothetical protein